MKKIKPEQVYVCLALVFGILFVFLTPPFQSPDEDSHFKKAYQVSKGVLYPGVKNKKYGNVFPKEMLTYIDEKLKYIGNRDKKYKYSEMVLEQYDTMDYNKVEFNNYSTASVSFVAYVVPATGITFSKVIAKVLGMENISISYMIYFARIFTLLFTIFLIYMAIKITPILKKTLVTISLMPMTLFLSGMITYDNIIIACSILTTAILLKLIYDKKLEKINWKYILSLIVLGFMLFNYKTIYCVVFILIFFIPKEKFGSLKDKLLKFLLIGGSVLALTVLFKLPMFFLPNVVDEGAKIASKQMTFVKSHLMQYISILFDNIINQRGYQLTSMVGRFGLIDTYLPIFVVGFYLVLLIFMALTEGTDYKVNINWKTRLSLIFAVCLGIVAVYTALYVGWTSQIYGIGVKDITGVQGRYFIPLLFPGLLIICNRKIKNYKVLQIVRNNYSILIGIVLLISTFTILLRYWV